MQPLSATVPLAHGSVTLRAWGAHITDALLLDLLKVSATLGELRQGGWAEVDAADFEQPIWEAFSRLLVHSLDGTALPSGTTLLERLALLEAMWELNDVPAVEGKLTALEARVAAFQSRIQDRHSASISSS